MGVQRLPSWRFIVPIIAAMAAIATLTALTINSGAPSVLIVDKAAESQTETAQTSQAAKSPTDANKAELPQIPGMVQADATAKPNQAAASKMFKYLSKESYTPEDEKAYLAKQLGVKATQRPDLWTLPDGQALRNSDNEAATSSLNVPYFSTYLMPQPHFTRGGMHDATRFMEDERARQGLNDDDGQYLSKDKGQKLSKELTNTIDSVFVQQVNQIYPARNNGPPISRASGQQLAAQLQAGEQYALLPNHGMAPRAAPVQYVSRANGAKLAQELISGEAQALALHEPRRAGNGPHLTVAQDSNLAKSLEAAQAWAQLPNHGRPMVQKRRMFSPEKIAQDKELAADLEAGERYAEAKKVMTSMHKERKLAKELQQGLHQVYNSAKIAKEWGIHQNPKLTLAQDKNVASYLGKGMDIIFPEPKPVVHHYLSPKNGEKLAKAGFASEYLEFKNDKIPQPKFLSASKGPALAAEMEASLHSERQAQGPYVAKYYARMQGKEAAHTAPHAFATHGMTKAQVKDKELAASLQQGLDYYNKMKHLAKYKKGQSGPHLLTNAQGRALADYLLPAKHIAKNEAPALGFAV